MYKLCSQIAFCSGGRKAVTLCFLLFCILCLGLVLTSAQPNAKLSSVTVQAEGIGATQSEASTDALIQAISKVNGVAIATQMSSSIKETYLNTDNREDYALTEDFQRNIVSNTKGVVRSWRILNAFQNPELNDLWVVKLEVDVSKYNSSKQLKRLRMSILPFRIGGDVSQIDNRTLFQKHFSRQLENYLTQSRRFAMLDRNFLSEQSKELSFIANEGVKIEEFARLGTRVGTDYIIVGEIEEARVTSKRRTMQTSDKTFIISKASGRVSYRIIDVASTQIKFSDTVEISVSGDGLAKAAESLANEAGETILNAIYPIRVVSGNTKQLTLGQGGITIKNGRTYNVIKLGGRIVDPYTKEVIGREEVIVGTVKIISVQAKSSTARVITSSEDLLPGIKNMSLIIRPLKHSDKSGSGKTNDEYKKTQEIMKNSKESINTLEKNSENDW